MSACYSDVALWPNDMTLRDYFAAKAMHALLSDRMPRNVEERELVCNLAYAVARGMLVAREAK